MQILTTSRKCLEAASLEEVVQTVTQDGEVVEGGSSILCAVQLPLDHESVLAASCHHGQTGTLANNPGVVWCETCSVSVLAGLHEGHLRVVNEVLEELGHELGQPPHTHEVSSRRVIGVLPPALKTLLALLSVVVTVAADNVLLDLLLDGREDAQGFVLSQHLNHELLVGLHDGRLVSNVYKDGMRALKHKDRWMSQSHHLPEKAMDIMEPIDLSMETMESRSSQNSSVGTLFSSAMHA